MIGTACGQEVIRVRCPDYDNFVIQGQCCCRRTANDRKIGTNEISGPQVWDIAAGPVVCARRREEARW